jgi:hypothetical protein
VLVFEFAVHRHESVSDAACTPQQIAVLGSRPAQALHCGYGVPNQVGDQVVRRFSSSSTRTCQQALACEVECSDSLFASYGRKLPEKFV